MKKEVYRSFSGKLGVDNQSGYIITETDNFYEVEFLNVWQDSSGEKARIKKEYLPESDFPDSAKIGELIDDITNGRTDAGQIMYHGKWYGVDTIRKIQEARQSGNWRKYA